MNIFALARTPYEAAQAHCDKHVVKMIVEYAQLLSTAHRVLDGVQYLVPRESGRLYEVLVLPGEMLTMDGGTGLVPVSIENPVCYRATHVNHPCAIWTRTSDANYHWLVHLFHGCLVEYTKRYAKKHSCEKFLEFFFSAPKKLVHGGMTPFALAMPDKYKVADEVLSYQNYYVGDKARFAKWTETEVPHWFTEGTRCDASNFQRTHRVSKSSNQSPIVNVHGVASTAS